MKNCNICGRALDQENDPLSIDCGGDCWGCIGEIEAEMGDQNSREKVRTELETGIRHVPVEGKVNQKRLLSEHDKALFLTAWSNFGRGENGKQACSSCGAPILFERCGSALSHHCLCGKFTGSLRGL